MKLLTSYTNYTNYNVCSELIFHLYAICQTKGRGAAPPSQRSFSDRTHRLIQNVN